MKRLLSIFLPKPPAPPPVVPVDPLDEPLLYFSEDERDAWTVRNACEGTMIFGATGSGKSSGSGRFIAEAFLRSGAGGLVLTCKTDERLMWEQYCRQTGRLDDLIVFSPPNPWRFNFMQYEFCRPGAGGRITENLVHIFSTIAEVLERPSQSSGPDYWSRAMNQLVRNGVDLAAAARGTISLDLVARIIASAPLSPDQARSVDWQRSSFCYTCITAGEAATKSELLRADWPQVVRFWLSEYPALSSRTRSCIVSMFSTIAEQLLRGEIGRLFCTGLNIDPETTFNDGRILVLDLPVKEFGEVGAMAQTLFKHIWQRSVERRDPASSPRPAFLWADESQHFITKYDAIFQMTSRSARVMTVHLTQSLPALHSVMGRNETESLLANLGTRIWHRNSCTVTNAAASETIARSRQLRFSTGTATRDDDDGDPHVSRTMSGSEAVEHQLLPVEFQGLGSGGPSNGNVVEGIVYQNGRLWSNGRSVLRSAFNQTGTP
jgi:hypothetical protein